MTAQAIAELDHLSYSSINSWLMCGANWKFHYLDKIKTPTSIPLVFGSSFHNTIESFVTQAITKPKKQQSIEEIWLEKWNKEITSTDENGEIIPRVDIDWADDSPEYHCNEGLRLLTNPDIYNGILSIKAGQDEAGAKVERKVELNVPGVPIPIVGYIDIITADGVAGDFKTSSKSWTEDKAEGEIQTLFYLAAMNQMGIATPDWKFRHYIFVKTKTPKFQLLEHSHNPGQLMWLFKMIANVWKGIEAGVFPENANSWKCSPNWCEYYGICRGK